MIPRRARLLVPLALATLVSTVASVSRARAENEPAQNVPAGSRNTEPLVLPPVKVIGSTPLPALGTPVEKYPGNVQSLTSDDGVRGRAADLTETLSRRLGSVNIIGNQSNPWQNDITYRGFLASPLTGAPIGLSMYLDGMRFNDGFGDTINWDLIPQSAIADIDLIPGSNPIYGLNTLGGALAVRTKNGRDYPGTTIGASGGSFGRWTVEGEHGGSRGPFDWYIAFTALDEDGWRDHSPSQLRQLFAKVGFETGGTSLDLTYVYASNDLVGNGLAPEHLLSRQWSAVYTFPDRTQNEMHLGHLRASQWLSDSLLLSGNAFFRDYRRRTLNGDAEVNCTDDVSGEQVFDAGGRPLHLGRCSGPSTGFFDSSGTPLGGTLGLQAEGEDRTTTTITQDRGGTVQLSHKGKIFGHGNSVTAGVAYDRHATRFTQREAESDLVPEGNDAGTQRTGPFATSVDVDTRQENVGVYATDTFDVLDTLALTVAARYQHATIEIRDRSGENPALAGKHSFWRISPSVGLAYHPSPKLTVFASYSEGFRAPTAAELTCADPDAPCQLPNAFLADPPLRPVVAHTYEIGARGKLTLGESFEWSLGLFRTDLQDDILFTVVQTGGAGFFQNVSQTRRQGVEAGISGAWKRLRYHASYAFVDATYQSTERLASVTEPGGVLVEAGDQIPGIPQHNLKVGAEVAVLDNLWIGANVVAASGSFLRGDDGNRRARTDGYTLLNLTARYEPIEHVELWARVDNVTDAHYVTGGALNFNAFSDPIAVERFVAPGAPISAWAGVSVRF